VFAFPNPFDEQLGTHFSFTLEGDAAANVLLRVYTVSGKLIYQRTEHTLFPGYHQIAWDGTDAEGTAIANGVYLYRLVAHTPQASVFKEGRLVKLRKPVHKTEVPE
jgi:flagellar hook assembly protein FlgD